jgi:EAL domain-containing protein (putative c-di-GMP-specific phosphodiesterase class I)
MFYNSNMDAAGVERLKLENELRRAIERKELQLHYQPQINTLTGTVTGAEALMRWPHPELGMIPPFKFIPLAEEMGLIGALGEWGLHEACRQMVELQALGLELPKVSVNVSALQFNQSFIRRVSEVLAASGLRPMRLQLELTEGIMMDNKEATLRALTHLKDLGVIAIIAMARSMRLQLVAEGVETREQYRFLRSNGASVIQGYLFSKPVPFGELKDLLAPGYFKDQIAELNAH